MSNIDAYNRGVRGERGGRSGEGETTLPPRPGTGGGHPPHPPYTSSPPTAHPPIPRRAVLGSEYGPNTSSTRNSDAV